MKIFLAASHSPNPFDLKAALLAGHAQHPVIIHFPIALFIASAVFELLAAWRKQPPSACFKRRARGHSALGMARMEPNGQPRPCG